MMRFFDTSRIRTRFNEPVVAVDGTVLSLDLYLPSEQGSYPILLHRTPANNNRDGRAGISLAPAERWKALAAQGYIVATADVRGRGDSEGEFTPFHNEAQDGATTLAWLRQHPESNGQFGVFGSGYSAFCAWATAVADGNVDAIASISPFGAVGQGLLHNNGSVRLDGLFWMHLIGGRSIQPANVPPWPRIHRHLPLQTMDEALGRSDIWWREWLNHLDPDDAYWEPLNLADRIKTLNTSGLHITGWWDGQLAAARDYYLAASQSRASQHLLIGPWDTAGVRRPQAKVGGFDFGPRSVFDIDEVMTAFFDQKLKGQASPLVPENARVFITGRNEWLDTQGWPKADSTPVDYHLSADLGANTRRGDGQLTVGPVENTSPSTVTHNPDRPILFQPEFISFATGANPQDFVLEQAPITARDEALVYTSAPLEKIATVRGRPGIVLTVKTDAADADLFVLLSDSFPLGSRDLHLSHGAIRLKTLDHFRPGEEIAVELELDELAHDFLPGHQVRLTVTPSLFPLYARNLQGGDYTHDTAPVLAEIELRQGRLVLPVTDEEEPKTT